MTPELRNRSGDHGGAFGPEETHASLLARPLLAQRGSRGAELARQPAESSRVSCQMMVETADGGADGC